MDNTGHTARLLRREPLVEMILPSAVQSKNLLLTIGLSSVGSQVPVVLFFVPPRIERSDLVGFLTKCEI